MLNGAAALLVILLVGAVVAGTIIVGFICYLCPPDKPRWLISKTHAGEEDEEEGDASVVGGSDEEDDDFAGAVSLKGF